MKVEFNTTAFEKHLKNLVEYSVGFTDGAKAAKPKLLDNLAGATIQALNQYIDTSARMNPEALHHIYEWYQTGSPNSRLYDLDYLVTGSGLSINSTFKQSTSIAHGSKTPFYDKARIMEAGIPVTIKPKTSKVLAFDDNGSTVFTSKPITIEKPGGSNVSGSYEDVFNEFFRVYFTQAFLKSSGLFDYIEKPQAYKDNFAAGIRQGKSVGVRTGFNWIANAKIGLE